MPNGPTDLERLAREFAKLKHAEIELWRNADALFSINSASGLIIVANSAWEKYLGWTTTDLHTKTWWSLVHPSEVDAVATNMARMDFADVGRHMRRLLHKRGHYETFIIFASAWVEEAGARVTYMTGIHLQV